MNSCKEFEIKDISKFIKDNSIVSIKCDVNHDEEYSNWLTKNPQFIWRRNYFHTCYKCDQATNNEKIRLDFLLKL